jgi:hypothetical protein
MNYNNEEMSKMSQYMKNLYKEKKVKSEFNVLAIDSEANNEHF